MEPAPGLVICKSCQQEGSGKYCQTCGQPLTPKRITVSAIVHEVFHFFTHLDKGFPYTLKKLIAHPGTMQREYVEGNRPRHQKPFSMFFISASFLAVSLYWINILLAKYFSAGDAAEAVFFNKYMVMLLIGSVPFLVLITYIFFFSSRYNIAEIAIFQLYTVSMMFLIVVLANGLKFIWPTMETRYIELPAILTYSVISFVNFFNDERRGFVFVKGLLCAGLFYVCVAMTQDYIVDHMHR